MKTTNPSKYLVVDKDKIKGGCYMRSCPKDATRVFFMSVGIDAAFQVNTTTTGINGRAIMLCDECAQEIAKFVENKSGATEDGFMPMGLVLL
jgi:hypothetical protein